MLVYKQLNKYSINNDLVFYIKSLFVELFLLFLLYMSNLPNNDYSQSFEKLGFIPRSIIRTVNRFNQQVTQKPTNLLLYEFKISRYQTIASLKCLLTFIVIPIFFHMILELSIAKFLNSPRLNNLTNIASPTETTLSFIEIQRFDEQYFFDSLTLPKFPIVLNIKNNEQRSTFLKNLKIKQFYTLQLKIGHIFSDLVTLIMMLILIKFSIPQIIILKSFFTEFLYNLSDTTKSFFLIFVTDLLVGFHSSTAWELGLLIFFNRFGVPIQHDLLLLIISIFPVILDTIFKYWIFRFLNKISPSTVATYQNMLE